VTVQGGGYGEHQVLSAAVDEGAVAVDASAFTCGWLPAPGAADLEDEALYNAPTLSFPWDRA
jgi:hypothetical protein